jgi:hypothetical protein
MDEQPSDWPQLYADYLRSRQWAETRAKVMARAQHRCEGCRDALATEVHHLTYENVTREFLFELVALCEGCHERVHAQRGQSTRPKAAHWEQRHKGVSAMGMDTPGARSRRSRLADLAAAHRNKPTVEQPENVSREAPTRRVGQ